MLAYDKAPQLPVPPPSRRAPRGSARRLLRRQAHRHLPGLHRRARIQGRRQHHLRRGLAKASASTTTTEGDESVHSASSPPSSLPALFPQQQQQQQNHPEMASLDFTEAPDESAAAALHLNKYPSWEIDWDSILS